MNREDKLEVFEEAVKLADSGKYKGWRSNSVAACEVWTKTSAGVARREEDTDDTGHSVQARQFATLGIDREGLTYASLLL